MAAVPVIISPCVIYDKYGRTTEVAAVMGMAQIAGLEVGGGPMPPGPGQPPGIWPGPGPLPHPEHPIAPGGRPPGIWGGPIDPYPGHPLPEPPNKPTEPPEPPTADKPPPPEGGWGWMASASQWGWFPPPGSAQPKA